MEYYGGKMKSITINLIDQFSKSPYGRDELDDKENNGKAFRQKFLVKELKDHKKVTVILDGYNRYGRSFLDEAFAGLIRDEGFTLEQIKKILEIKHRSNPIFEAIIKERMESAEEERKNKVI